MTRSGYIRDRLMENRFQIYPCTIPNNYYTVLLVLPDTQKEE